MRILALALLFFLTFFCVVSVLDASVTLLFREAYGHPMTRYTRIVMGTGEFLFSVFVALGVINLFKDKEVPEDKEEK